MKTYTILIRTSHGDRPIKAYLCGKFAVHRSLYDDGELPAKSALWHITHRMTGLSVTSRWGLAAARQVAEQLNQAVEHDVTSDDYHACNEAWHTFGRVVASIGKDNGDD